MKKIIARKIHRCDNCACNILKGETYNYDTFYQRVTYDSEFDIKSGGHIVKWRTHLAYENCEAAMNRELYEMLGPK